MGSEATAPDVVQTIVDFAKLLKERYIDKGKLGTSTGEGFYSYPKK